MTIDDAINKLKAAEEKVKRAGTKILNEELRKAVKLNFADQGRPRKWDPKKRPDGRAILTGRTGNGQRSINFDMNESTGENRVGSKLIYMPAHQTGATIHHPARTYKFRKVDRYNKDDKRLVFARHSRKTFDHTKQGKAYDVNLPARPWAVWTEADTRRAVPLLIKAAEGSFL